MALSPSAVILDPSRVLNGAYGELYDGATFLAAVQSFEARITVDRLEVRRSGTRRMGYKRGMISGAGTLTGFKVSSLWAERFATEYAEDGTLQSAYTFESRLLDPEAVGDEVVTFTGVRVWELPVGWSTGELVQEDIPFTFEGYTVDTPLTGVVTVAR